LWPSSDVANTVLVVRFGLFDVGVGIVMGFRWGMCSRGCGLCWRLVGGAVGFAWKVEVMVAAPLIVAEVEAEFASSKVIALMPSNVRKCSRYWHLQLFGQSDRQCRFASRRVRRSAATCRKSDRVSNLGKSGGNRHIAVIVMLRVVPVPVPSPLQLTKFQPLLGDSVSVTTSPKWYGAEGLAVTDPHPRVAL